MPPERSEQVWQNLHNALEKKASEAEKLRAALENILAFADGMLLAQNAINTPDDAPERKTALWLHTETTTALNA